MTARSIPPLRRDPHAGASWCGKAPPRPNKDCPFISGLLGGKARQVKDGFFEHGAGNARLVFPEGVWKGAKGTRFRFTLDMRTI